MMHAYLITGQTEKARRDYATRIMGDFHVSPFDTIMLEPTREHIGIADVRLLLKSIPLAPVYSKNRIALIPTGDLLTLEAQNALLKTLEEPPPYAAIIICAKTSDALLPTIVSRCQIINLPSSSGYSETELQETKKTIDALLSLAVGERVKMIDQIAKTREDAKLFLDKSVFALHKTLPAALLRKILLGREQLSVNVNPKLVLDNIFLN